MVVLLWTACRPDPLNVALEVREGVRDLVATVEPAPADAVYEWTLDDAPSAITGPRVPATEIWPGQRWSVRVTDGDGATGTASATIPAPPGGNVIVIMLDDVGVDKLAVYDPANPAVDTPNIDSLAAEGVLFENAYTSPMCSAARANLLTGRYGRRTGMGSVLDLPFGQLPYGEVLTPEMLHLARDGRTWTSEALGKWNLGSENTDLAHPNGQGFDYFSGIFTVMSAIAWPQNDYFYWAEVTNGVAVGWSDVYNTTDIANDAIERLAVMPEPFFLYVAMNAAHDPLHLPPADLFTVHADDTSLQPELYDAMLQAADTEIGRILASMPADLRARTTIVFTSDNGTQFEAVEPPYIPERSKRSVYEGGTRVPLIVTGPHVAQPGSRSSALVHMVDLFTTVADIAGAPIVDTASGPALVLDDGTERTLDGLGLLPYLRDPSTPGERQEMYTEVFMPNGIPPYAWEMTAVRTLDYKLVRETGLRDELYRMVPGAIDEGNDLLTDGISPAEQAVLDDLTARLDAWGDALPFDGLWDEK